MDLRGDERYVLEIDRRVLSDFAEVVRCLQRTDEYVEVPVGEVETELLQSLVEMWVEAEFYAISSLVDVLNDNSHDTVIERCVPLLEQMSQLDGPDFRETRRSTEYLRQILRNEPDQVRFDNLSLNKGGRTITVKIIKEEV